MPVLDCVLKMKLIDDWPLAFERHYSCDHRTGVGQSREETIAGSDQGEKLSLRCGVIAVAECSQTTDNQRLVV